MLIIKLTKERNKIWLRLVNFILALNLLYQPIGFAETNNTYLAPASGLPSKEGSNHADKYQLILERFIKYNPECASIPKNKFEEFIRSAETLFNEYRSYSRFPFNPQTAVQFVENKRPLIHEIKRLFIEALGHIKKKDSCSRREGMRRLEEVVKSKLGAGDYVAVNLMGRPGVGKSTIAGKIKKGFANLQSDEILVIPVDGFRNNNVALVNQLIAHKNALNTPLKELSDADYAFFETVSKSLQFPLLRNSDKSFLDFYLVAEEREQETGENKRDFRRRQLWNHIGSNPRLQMYLDVPFKSMSIEVYNEFIRIAKGMRMSNERMRKYSDRSFSDVYKEVDNEEFLASVRDKKKATADIKLFIVEGTYSYQGENIFDSNAERLMQKHPGQFVKVMIELDEDIRQQRIRDRHRSDMEEMLILGPIFDGIFSGSIDLERNFADIIIDNTESTDIFQIKQTHSGIKAQFGIISETARATLAREFFEKEAPPDIYILPPELFRGGRSYADLEFLIYPYESSPPVRVGVRVGSCVLLPL